LAGSESRGLAASDPFLFQNAIYALTPAPSVPPATLAAFRNLLETTGARTLLLESGQHDRIVAATSHLPQLVAVALMQVVGARASDDPTTFQLAAGGFRDMTRIASSPFDIWRNICTTNRDAIVGAIDECITALREISQEVGTEALGEAFEAAGRARATIPRDTKGWLSPLHQLLVTLEDRPGALVSVLVPLAERGINVSDVEVLKVREHEGGTILLGFTSADDARQAEEIIGATGATARLRA
jgi:prephenate dehydrogenase